MNTEPYWGYQWNIRQIRADLTAAARHLGDGAVRARVAVLDAGIWTAHPDIAAERQCGLEPVLCPRRAGHRPDRLRLQPRHPRGRDHRGADQ